MHLGALTLSLILDSMGLVGLGLPSQLIDVTNGQVGLGLGQVNRVVGKKGHFKRVRNESGQSSYKLGRVRLTCIFHIKFFLFKKTICVCHLESHATNYLM